MGRVYALVSLGARIEVQIYHVKNVIHRNIVCIVLGDSIRRTGVTVLMVDG